MKTISTKGRTQQLDENENNREDLLLLKIYQQLNEINPDFIGWIHMKETDIDYPVMQTLHQEDYYMHRNFQKKYCYEGIPYVSKYCDIKKPGKNTLIFGNHSKAKHSLCMFHAYQEEEYFKRHSIIHFDTIYHFGAYQILAVFPKNTKCNTQEQKKYAMLETKQEYDNYIQEVKKRSYYETGVVAVYGESLLTISGCCNQNNGLQQIVIVAKKLGEEL